MIERVGDSERIAVKGHAQRMLETGGIADAVIFAETEEIAAARDCLGRSFCVGFHGANRGYLRIGNIKMLAVAGQAGGLRNAALHISAHRCDIRDRYRHERRCGPFSDRVPKSDACRPWR